MGDDLRGNCDDCDYWEALSPFLGLCRRYPPFTPIGDGCWCKTSHEDWCGEWLLAHPDELGDREKAWQEWQRKHNSPLGDATTAAAPAEAEAPTPEPPAPSPDDAR